MKHIRIATVVFGCLALWLCHGMALSLGGRPATTERRQTCRPDDPSFSGPTRLVAAHASEPDRAVGPRFTASNKDTAGPVSSAKSEDEPKQDMFPRWWGARPAIETTVPCKDPGACIKCHETKKMDPSHAFACVKCHRGDPNSTEEDQAHKGLVKDPGDLGGVSGTCGSCHPDEVRRVERSPMALATRMIAHTRFAFAAAKSVTP